jgi:hypothetical protein
MAASSYTIWEMRYNGSDLNTSCFDPNPTLATTLSSGNGTSNFPTVSSSSYNFSASDVGHFLYVKSGTNWTPGWYQITSATGSSCVLNATSGQYVGANLEPIGKNGVGIVASLSSGSWTIDYTQSSSARYSYSDINIPSSTTLITSTGSTFTPAHIGNTIRLYGSAGVTTSIYLITAIAGNGTNATVDRACGSISTTNILANVGGGTTSFRQLFLDQSNIIGGQSGSMVYMKNNGIFYFYGNSNFAGQTTPTFAGYGTFRFDRQKTSVYAGETNAYAFPRGDGLWMKTKELIFSGNGFTGVRAYSLGNNQGYSLMINCEFYNLSSNVGAGIIAKKCYFYNVSAPGCVIYENCEINSCIATGQSLIGGNTQINVWNCLIRNNTGVVLQFNPGGGVNPSVFNCTFYNNSSDVISLYNNFTTNTGNNRSTIHVYNNIFANNGGNALNSAQDFAIYEVEMENNVFYSNSSSGIGTGTNSFSSTKLISINPIFLNQSPFVNAANGDFRLNDEPSGGRLCKGVGAMSPFYSVSAPRNINAGAYQNQVVPLVRGNMNGGMN